jgi:DNA-binding phage protein
MKASKPYKPYLINSLKDPLEADAYLKSVFEDGTPEEVALAKENIKAAELLRT